MARRHETAAQRRWQMAHVIRAEVKINCNQDPELYRIFQEVEERGESRGALLRQMLREALEARKKGEQ